MRTEAEEAGEAGVRVDTPVWKLSLPRAPNDVVFFTVSAVGLVAVLWKVIDRFSGSGALLIAAQIPVVVLFGYLIRAFSARPRVEEPPGRARPRSRRRPAPVSEGRSGR